MGHNENVCRRSLSLEGEDAAMDAVRVAAQFVRERWLLVVSAFAAVASMVAVPPDAAYLAYFDWQTLGCLFCVLAVAAAFRLMGAFDYAARAIVGRLSRPRVVCLALVLVTAALSAVATNDVALIVMLPLSAATLVGAGWLRLVPAVFVLQTLAANLCGMITPFGNPQNLYLYSYYALDLGDFLCTMAPPFAVSLIGIVAATWLLTARGEAAERREGAECREGARCGKRAEGNAGETCVAANDDGSRDCGEVMCAAKQEGETRCGGVAPALADKGQRPAGKSTVACSASAPVRPLSRRRVAVYGALLALVLLAVFRVVPVALAALVVAVVLAAADRRALAAVDWALLLTFACFFVFAGNMARLPVLAESLGAWMGQAGLVVSAGASQVISNVPAAILLSHFTDAWQPLLVGVNIGGAGTPVGSLASLIAIQHFASAHKIFPPLRAPDAPSMSDFLRLFAVLNFAALAILLAVCQAIYA